MSVYDFCPFLVGLFIFLLLSCLCILEIGPLSIVSFAIIFSHTERYVLILLIISSAVKKLLSLIRSYLGEGNGTPP